MDSSIRFSVLPHRELEAAQAVLDLQFASYRVEAEVIGVSDFPPLRRTVEQVRAAEAEFIGCWRGGWLVAVAEVSTEQGEKSIDAFNVHPKAFRQGLGSRLLEFLLARFSAESMTVCTATSNRPAISLYEAKGFRWVESWTNSHGIEMVRFRHGRP